MQQTKFKVGDIVRPVRDYANDAVVYRETPLKIVEVFPIPLTGDTAYTVQTLEDVTTDYGTTWEKGTDWKLLGEDLVLATDVEQKIDSDRQARIEHVIRENEALEVLNRPAHKGYPSLLGEETTSNVDEMRANLKVAKDKAAFISRLFTDEDVTGLQDEMQLLLNKYGQKVDISFTYDGTAIVGQFQVYGKK